MGLNSGFKGLMSGRTPLYAPQSTHTAVQKPNRTLHIKPVT